jgi:hypothetical protein
VWFKLYRKCLFFISQCSEIKSKEGQKAYLKVWGCFAWKVEKVGEFLELEWDFWTSRRWPPKLFNSSTALRVHIFLSHLNAAPFKRSAILLIHTTECLLTGPSFLELPQHLWPGVRGNAVWIGFELLNQGLIKRYSGYCLVGLDFILLQDIGVYWFQGCFWVFVRVERWFYWKAWF